MGGGDGFAVERDRLDKAVGQLDGASHDFDVVVKAFQGSVCYAPAAFGEFGMDGAYSGFDSAWGAELRQTGNALTELIEKMRAAEASYGRADLNSAHRVQAARR